MQLLSKYKIRQILAERFAKDTITALRDLPKPDTLKDMQKATARIVQAIKNSESIILVSDYDVDGVSSRVLFEEFFDAVALKYEVDFECITPNRFTDGYGLNSKLLYGKSPKVVITVDNGITSYEAADYCVDNGIDLIVTDHHIASKLPNAYAIVNPKQPDCDFVFKDICGAQVAWYLIASLKDALSLEFSMSDCLDILTLAIVADVMPLVGMNRVLVKRGLKCMSGSDKPAFMAIRESLDRCQITSEDVGFGIAPKLNAAGRMQDASLAVDFLRSNNLTKASESFKLLTDLNTHRKDMQEQMFLKTLEHLEHRGDEPFGVVVCADKTFHEGIVGIVASKVAEHYKKVALIGHINEAKGIVKFSARSFGEVDIYTLIKSCEEFLIGFGGHTQAAGLSISIDDLEKFTLKINEVFKENFHFKMPPIALGSLNLDEVDDELVGILDSFEPFGEGNPRPSFYFENVSINSAHIVGKNRNCLKFVLNGSFGLVEAIKFFALSELVNKVENMSLEKMSFCAQVGLNEFRGIKRIQLVVGEIVAIV